MALPSLLTTLLIHSAALAFLAPSSFADNVLLAGNSLQAGQKLENGHYTFLMQADCNLVLYDGDSAVWSSNTVNKLGLCRLTMQTDRNLVIYSSDNKVVWASNTWKRGNYNYALILQRDRNVAIYGPGVWSTGTSIRSRNSTKFAVVAGDEIPGK